MLLRERFLYGYIDIRQDYFISFGCCCLGPSMLSFSSATMLWCLFVSIIKYHYFLNQLKDVQPMKTIRHCVTAINDNWLTVR